jgi:hypothetical protein
MKMTALLVENFFGGLKAVVLPTLPMPEDPYCFYKARGQYDTCHVWKRMRLARKLPDDAILLVNVTEKNLTARGMRYIYTWWNTKTFQSTVTYAKWYHISNDVIAEMLAKFIAQAFNKHATNSLCFLKSCLFRVESYCGEIEHTPFRICDGCAARYKDFDFEAMKQRGRKAYGRKAYFGRRDKRKWQDAYDEIVSKTLRKTNEKSNAHKSKLLSSIASAAEIAESELEPGLEFEYYEFAPKTVNDAKDLQSLTSMRSGVSAKFEIANVKRKKYFAMRFDGYIKISNDGIYQFILVADDGGILAIDGKELVNIYGRGGALMKSAEIALKTGFHKVRLTYFQATGANKLNIYYRGPETRGCEVPATVLFHKRNGK